MLSCSALLRAERSGKNERTHHRHTPLRFTSEAAVGELEPKRDHVAWCNWNIDSEQQASIQKMIYAT